MSVTDPRHDEALRGQPSLAFDLKSILVTTAVVLWAATIVLFIVASASDWSMHTERALLVGALCVALVGCTTTVATIQLRIAGRRHVADAAQEAAREERSAALLSEVQAGKNAVLDRLDRLERASDDTVTNLSDLMGQVRQLLEDSAARHEGIVEEMRKVAAESLEVAMRPDGLAQVHDLAKRVAAGPNGTARPAN